METLVEKSVVEKYVRDKQGELRYVLVYENRLYKYANEKDRAKHVEEMTAEGFKVYGNIRENLGTCLKPENVYIGRFVLAYKSSAALSN